MKYEWIDYSHEYKTIADAWLDDEAIRFTGCDDGFDEFYKYWLNEPETKLGENFWAKIFAEDGIPVGVVAIAMWEGVFTVSEIIVCPDKRGCGAGSAALSALLAYGKSILGTEITNAKAVIFPNNVASKRAFEKAGFNFSGEHPDGDALYYEYNQY